MNKKNWLVPKKASANARGKKKTSGNMPLSSVYLQFQKGYLDDIFLYFGIRSHGTVTNAPGKDFLAWHAGFFPSPLELGFFHT